jgi:hypothetical protein
MANWSVTQKPDDVLLRDLTSIVRRDRLTTAEMLSHIAEVHSRGLYRAAAYPSMYKYCVFELHMSEHEAYKRIRVAQAAREFPVLLEMLGDGRLHLSGALTLVAALTRDTADELLSGAVHKTRAQIEQMLADRFPKPDVATSLQAVPAPDQAAQVTPGSSASPSSELACEPAETEIPCHGSPTPELACVSGETGTPSVDPHVSLNTSEHFFAPGPAVPSLAAKAEHREGPLPAAGRRQV